MWSAAGDFGLNMSGVGDDLFLVERRGKGLNELEVAQVLQERATPLSQRLCHLPASLLEFRGGRGVQSSVFLGAKTPEIVLILADGQSVPRRCARQQRPVDTRATHQATQVGDVGMQGGSRSRWWALISGGADQHVDVHRSIGI